MNGCQGNPQALRHLDHCHPPQGVAWVAALVAGAAGAVDQTLALVEVQRGHGYAAARRQLTHAEYALS
ncbi:hypothetical protein D3C84_1013680 [compost metagenome]